MSAVAQSSGLSIEKANSVMWVANVRALPFGEQLRAAELAGFGGISVTPLGWHQLIAEGISSADMRVMLADHGITSIHLDPLARWTTRWRPENLPTFPVSFFAFDVDDFLRIAEGVGATSMTAIATFPLGTVPIDQMTEDFAVVADRAAGLGLRCSLEFIPLDWAIPDLATAWTIVKGAERQNTGLVIDTWCFHRGASSLELLKTIPGEYIDFVQLADGFARAPAERSWIDDNLQNRLPPGQGEFALVELLQILAGTGGLNSVAPELFAWQLDGMPAEPIADIVRSSLVSIAEGAGIAHDLGSESADWRQAFAAASRRAGDEQGQRSHI